MKTTYKIIGVIVVGLVAFLLGLTTAGTSTEQTPADRINIADPYGKFETQSLGNIIRFEIAQQLAETDNKEATITPDNSKIEELEKDLEDAHQRITTLENSQKDFVSKEELANIPSQQDIERNIQRSIRKNTTKSVVCDMESRRWRNVGTPTSPKYTNDYIECMRYER